ncbi:MAG: iron uptake porin [Leptolyngbyaceae bacterium]|nr:iron uptake porin [Leptolyngbyaceae bacterium]
MSSSTLLGVALTANPSTLATEAPSSQSITSQPQQAGIIGTADQVTSVSQLADVQPTDWAFQALQSLVERYGVIAGYPDGKFRGNRALTRYEFVAGLNAALDRVNELIAAGTADLVTKEDLATLQKLQEEFSAELATLRGRVDALETRTAQLEAQQFSTTTKLSGEAIFALSDSFGGTSVTGFGGAPANADRSNTVFQNRVRLNLTSSFMGWDRLRVRLQAGNANPVLTSAPGNPAVFLFSNEGRFSYDDSTVATSNGSFNLGILDYRLPLSRQLNVNFFANGAFHYHYADTLNPFFDSEGGGSGALSRFAERNPIYEIGRAGAGIGFNYRFSQSLKLDFGYLASNANDPSPSAGLFNGNYSALAQIVFHPNDQFRLGLTYVNAYNAPGTFGFGVGGTGVGTFAGNLLPGSLPGIPRSAVASNSYGVQAVYQFSPQFVLGGWAGLTEARLIGFGDAEIWNYAVTLAFPDLGKKGNLGGLIVGVEPTLKGLQSGGVQVPLRDRDDALHVEGFYKYQLTDNISLTPGLIWLPAVNQRSVNDDIFIGTLRTTFNF